MMYKDAINSGNFIFLVCFQYTNTQVRAHPEPFKFSFMLPGGTSEEANLYQKIKVKLQKFHSEGDVQCRRQLMALAQELGM